LTPSESPPPALGHRWQWANLRSVDPIVLGSIALAVTIRIIFWAYTGRTWEDALITAAHAQSAVQGIGLTHHPGEGVVQGFTSALSVLIPLLGEAVMPDGGLFLLRLVSLVAAVATIVIADRLGVLLGLSRPARWLVAIFLAVEQNQVFYGMAGMETQLAVATLLGSLYLAIEHRGIRAGVALGVALLARPDFVLLVPAAAIGLRRPADVAKAAVALSLVIAPWVLFTTLYYGSPIPNTILAKAASFGSIPDGDFVIFDWITLQAGRHVETLLRNFTPFFADTLVHGAPIPREILFTFGLAVWIAAGVGAIAALRSKSWWPLLALLVVYGAYRVLFLPAAYFDWYVPPFTAVAIFAVARGLDVLPRRATWMLAATIAVCYAVTTLAIMPLERTVQQVAEDGVRRKVADYVRVTVPAGSPVVAESAGYFGYYADVLLWEFPGLTSRTAYTTLRGLPRPQRTLHDLIDVLRPDWVILRPNEYAELALKHPAVAPLYRSCTTIGPGGSTIEALGVTKGTGDLRFSVYRRGECP
jgi:hypothetical protein